MLCSMASSSFDRWTRAEIDCAGPRFAVAAIGVAGSPAPVADEGLDWGCCGHPLPCSMYRDDHSLVTVSLTPTKVIQTKPKKSYVRKEFVVIRRVVSITIGKKKKLRVMTGFLPIYIQTSAASVPDDPCKTRKDLPLHCSHCWQSTSRSPASWQLHPQSHVLSL